MKGYPKQTLNKKQYVPEDFTDTPPAPPNRWRLRCIVAIVMLIIAFIGMVLVRTSGHSGKIPMYYWLGSTPIYLILTLILRRSDSERPQHYVIFKSIFHWLAILLTLGMIHFYVQSGIMGSFEASLVEMNIVALGIFLVGVYLDSTCMLIGIMMAILALAISWASQFIVPMMIGTGIIFAILVFAASKAKGRS